MADDGKRFAALDVVFWSGALFKMRLKMRGGGLEGESRLGVARDPRPADFFRGLFYTVKIEVCGGKRFQ